MSILIRLQQIQYRLLSKERAIQGRHDKTIGQGPFLAVRRTAFDEVIKDYTGTGKNGGDDIDLTLLLMERGWKSVYQSSAKAYTQPKTTWKGYLKQQLRWHRSWYREWPRTRKQLTGHSWLLTIITWTRTLMLTPLRFYAYITRKHKGWLTRKWDGKQ